jgi:hypothetical protein
MCSCNARRSQYEFYGTDIDTATIDTASYNENEDSVSADMEASTDDAEYGSFSSANDNNDEYEQMKKHPEYRKGGKYDPKLYHTDDSHDATGEQLRREYIDEDGYDADDDYDENYGYDWRQY